MVSGFFMVFRFGFGFLSYLESLGGRCVFFELWKEFVGFLMCVVKLNLLLFLGSCVRRVESVVFCFGMFF